MNLDGRRHNIREAIKALEYLLEVEQDPERKAGYQSRLDEQRRLLDIPAEG